MLIESLAQKTRLAMMTVLATIGGCAVIMASLVFCAKDSISISFCFKITFTWI